MQNVVHHKKIFLSSFLALLLCSLQYRYSYEESTLCNLGKYILGTKMSIILASILRKQIWWIYIQLSLDDFYCVFWFFLINIKNIVVYLHFVLLNIVQCSKSIFFIFCLLVDFNVHSIPKWWRWCAFSQWAF